MSDPAADESPNSGDTTYACPECGRAFDVGADAPESLIRCEACGAQFYLPQDDTSPVVEDESEAPEVHDRADELDGARIRRHATLKRSLYRSRSYATVAAVGFGVIAGHTLWLAINELQTNGLTRWVGYYSAVILVGGFIALVATRKAVALHREARSPLLAPQADDPPDFSTLGGGSQIVRDLNDVR